MTPPRPRYMRRSHGGERNDPLLDVLNVVIDDATAERLRAAAEDRGIEVEQLIVHVIHRASWHVDDVLGDEDDERKRP